MARRTWMAGPIPEIPATWAPLRAETDQPYYRRLAAFLEGEYHDGTVFPPAPDVFRALELTALPDARVVLLGQDPYHGPGQAHGLAFSVRPGVPQPPSLRNLFRELHDDTGVPVPGHGNLEAWGRGGVLLLNTVLTVREGAAGSHAGRGWERFTDRVIELVNERQDPAVFLLLGGHARKKARMVDRGRHAVIEAPHPSPLSAHRGFFGSRIFSRVNEALEAAGRGAVDWRV